MICFSELGIEGIASKKNAGEARRLPVFAFTLSSYIYESLPLSSLNYLGPAFGASRLTSLRFLHIGNVAVATGLMPSRWPLYLRIADGSWRDF